MKKLIFIVFTILFVYGCTVFSITPSAKRNPVLQSVRLSNDVVLTHLGAVHMYVMGIVNTDFLPAGFMIETPDKIIYIDPLGFTDPKPADYIFVTHAHSDHLALNDIKKIAKPGTVVIGPLEVTKTLRGYTTKNVVPGEKCSMDGISFEVVPAYNVKPGFLGIIPHAKSSNKAGYIIETRDVRIYHAGDTDYVPEMDNIKNITAALLPINGDNLSMSTERAAELSNKIAPSIVIPMHYEPGKNYAQQFERLVDKQIKVIVLE
ncbi:MAG: MBL fold metallo-hydrolase [Elusimicrobiota bacterium]